MRLAVTLRAILYLLIGSAAAFWILVIRTYPGERTVWDKIQLHRHDRWRAVQLRRLDCSWRIAFCSEIPRAEDPLRPRLDSAFAEAPTALCGGLMATHGAGLGWDVENRYLMSCMAKRGDTAVSVLLDEKGRIYSISRSWDPGDLASEYERVREAMTTAYGRDSLCPPNDDRAYTDDRRWQIGAANVGIGKAFDSLLTLDWSRGPIACHIGP